MKWRKVLKFLAKRTLPKPPPPSPLALYYNKALLEMAREHIVHAHLVGAHKEKEPPRATRTMEWRRYGGFTGEEP